MGRYKARYGLSARAVCTIYESNWRQKKLNLGSGWENFDDFVKWASETGYVNHARLRRVREDMPYGPDNAYWDFPHTAKKEYPDGHPCKDCEQDDDCCVPCDIRLQYWDAVMAQIRGLMEVHGND